MIATKTKRRFSQKMRIVGRKKFSGVEEYAQSFTVRIKQKRLELGLTQVDLARESGIPFATWSHYEKAHKTPSFKNLIKIATTLNVSIDWLVGRR